jgi:hypothetical protein
LFLVICIGGLLIGCRGPAGEEIQRLFGFRADLGGEDEHRQIRVGDERHPFVVQLEKPDKGVVEPLGAGVVVADVVSGPACAELIASGGELADEIAEVAVERVSAGLLA